eukprot:jgi/Psemu1/312121/fgenesh1_kg.887_\
MRTRIRKLYWTFIVLSVAFVAVVGASSKNSPPHLASPSTTIQNIEITTATESEAKLTENEGKDAAVKKKKRTQPKKKRTNTGNNKTNGTTNGKRSYSSGGTTSTSLRRIKKEYKDAVDMGIAYDWVNQRRITRKTKTKKASSVNGRTENWSSSNLCLGPITTNLRQWHFSFRGAGEGAYSQGIYHGQILLPKDYPMSPPSVQMWTPSGRFIPGKDICLSASNYHPESWTPRWSIQGIVNALRLHMLNPPNEIGGMQSTHDEATEFARLSLAWRLTWRDGGKIVTVDHRRLLEEGILSDGTLGETIDGLQVVEDCRIENDEEEENENEYDLESELYQEAAVEDDDTKAANGILEYNDAEDKRIRFRARLSLSMTTITSLFQLACLYLILLLFVNR